MCSAPLVSVSAAMVLGGNRKRNVGIPSFEGRVIAISAKWRGRLRGSILVAYRILHLYLCVKQSQNFYSTYRYRLIRENNSIHRISLWKSQVEGTAPPSQSHRELKPVSPKKIHVTGNSSAVTHVPGLPSTSFTNCPVMAKPLN